MEVARKVFAKTTKGRSQLPMRAFLEYFDMLEVYLDETILSLEERDFLIEFVIDCTSESVDWSQFQQVVRRLLNRSLEEIVNSAMPDYEPTMGVTKFNKLVHSRPKGEQTSLIRERIDKLEALRAKSKSVSLRDSLIECYKLLQSERDVQLERIKRGVDKQDIIIQQLKRKTKLAGFNWGKLKRYVLWAFATFILVSFIVL